jgi:hypothetical protein
MTQIVNIKHGSTFSSIPDKIKKELTIIKFDIEEYKKELEKYGKDRPSNHCYYDYNLELDFSENLNPF